MTRDQAKKKLKALKELAERGVSEEEFELTDRLKMKICQCVEEEIELLKKELEELH